MNGCMDMREWQEEEEEEEEMKTLMGLIGHLGYFSHCDRHPFCHREKLQAKDKHSVQALLHGVAKARQ